MPLWGVLLLVTVAMVLVLLIAMPQMGGNENAQLNDINFPDNSNSKAVPIAFGTVWMYGNILFYTNPQHRVIKACQ